MYLPLCLGNIHLLPSTDNVIPDNVICLYVSCLLNHNNYNKMPIVYSITLWWEQWRLYSKKNRDNALTFAFLSFELRQKKHVYCNIKLMESLQPILPHVLCTGCCVLGEITKHGSNWLFTFMKISENLYEKSVLRNLNSILGQNSTFQKECHY